MRGFTAATADEDNNIAMIRRDCRNAEGKPCWLLISQPEHARLSGVLAEAWGAPPLRPMTPRDELLSAIFHHDDGWFGWEKRPQVDSQSGRPVQFTEMPVAESVAIWRGSIAEAARFGDLAPWAVAGHFAALLRSATTWRKAGGEQARIAEEFLSEQESQRATWLSRWLAADAANTVELAERALRALQFFDALSLWFCCAERTTPQSFDAPARPQVVFTPMASERLGVEPWPFTVRELGISVVGREVEQAKYESAAHLAGAPSREVELRWVLGN